jgi:hypothetical protein
MKTRFILIIFIIFWMGILSLTGCKSSEETDVYDIRGKWVLISWNPGSNDTYGAAMDIAFSGSDTNGTAVGFYFLWVLYGTYSVTDTQVTISLNFIPSSTVATYSGAFIDPDHISGTWEGNNITGLFDLRR